MVYGDNTVIKNKLLVMTTLVVLLDMFATVDDILDEPVFT